MLPTSKLSIPYLQAPQMERLTQLRNQSLDLTNRVLPDLAQQRRFLIRFNHCFQRIVLDNLFNGCWYDVLNRREPVLSQTF